AARQVRVEPVDLPHARRARGGLRTDGRRPELVVRDGITDQERELARLAQQVLEAVVGDRLDDRVRVRRRQAERLLQVDRAGVLGGGGGALGLRVGGRLGGERDDRCGGYQG